MPDETTEPVAQPETETASLRAVIAEMLRRQRWWLVLAVVLSLFSIFVSVSTAVTVKSAFDDAIVARTVPLKQLIDALVFLALWGFVIGIPLRLTTSRVVYQLEYDMRTWLYDLLQRVDPKALVGLPSGQLVTRAITDLATLEELTAVMPVLVVGGVLLSAAAIVMVAINPVMGLVSLVAIPINVIIVARMAGRMRALSWLLLNRRAQVTTRIDEPVRGIRVVKAFAAEPAEEHRVAMAAVNAYTVAMTRIRLLARFGLPVKLIPLLLNAVLIYLGATLTISGSFTIGALVIYLGFAVIFTAIAGQLDDIVGAYSFARSGSSRILELITSAAPEPPPAVATLPDRPTTGLALHVAADHEAPMVDLVAPVGTWVAITGPPGSGTSALGRIAVGAEPPARGEVRLDGVDLAELSLAERKRAARVLGDEPFLFGRSVRENLLIGIDVPTEDAALWAALWAAGADEFVAALTGGLDAELGDRGLTLSGGQRQRVALARALVRPPRLLVLDDALSAVNPVLETEILRRIRDHAPATTVVLVTRRSGPLSMVEHLIEMTEVTPVTPVAEVALLDDPDAPSFDRPGDPGLAAAIDALVIDPRRPRVTDAEALEDAGAPTVRSILRPVRGNVAMAALALLALSLAAITPAILFQFAVDGIRDNDPRPATLVALALIPVAAAVSLLTYGARLMITQVNETALYVLRLRVFRRLSRLGVDYYDRELPGKVAARVVYDFDRVTEFINNGAFPLASSLVLFITAGVVLAVVNLPVFAVVVPFVIVMVIATAIEIPLAQRAYVAARTRVGLVVERFHEDFSGRHVLESFGGREVACEEFAALCWSLRQSRRRATSISNVYLAVMQMLAALATAILLSRAGTQAIDDAATIGSVVFLQLLLTQALAPVPALSGILQTYLNARASLAELGQPFAAPISPVERADARPCPELRGEIELRGVTFCYPGTDQPVLRAVDLHIAAGEVVALVGPTGAGKSTLAKVIARLYDPDTGLACVDGTDLRQIDLRSYRSRLGVVPQDAFCFSGTVGANITYGRPDASAEAVAKAIRDCGGSALLTMIPDGMDTDVTEEGANLPPLARQWIALARMWLVEPDVLVLDEATSGLPADDEQRVMDALRATGRTSVVVTHRLEVARRADRIVVVDNGVIGEQGTHAELVGAGGLYAAMCAHGQESDVAAS